MCARPRCVRPRLLAVEHVEEEGKAMLYLVRGRRKRRGCPARALAAR